MLVNVLKRATALFVVSIGILVSACVAMWWHYTRADRHFCGLDSGEPILCYSTAWYFGPSGGELLALLSLYFAFCCAIAWFWIWARNKFSAGPGEA